MAINEQKRILIAPLDWGLGHTTRCIPIIKRIQDKGHTVLVAGNNAQSSFIKGIYPNIEFIHLPGYNITYSRWNKWAQMGLLSQLPSIRRSIAMEHEWLKKLTAEQQLDGIISDNRYGLFHNSLPSVIITHQLMVRSGLGTVTDRAIQMIHNRYLSKFTSVWVPDIETSPGLAGQLSHPAIKLHNTKYIGLLSRFGGMQLRTDTSKTLLVLISGPDPQRSALSKMLWRQVLHHHGKVIFAEGNNTAIPPENIPAHITYHKLLNAKTLEYALIASDIIISRSGYSTLMDLVALKKKAIIIPTPGQTEQEYLGKELHRQGVFYSARQDNFDLNKCLTESSGFPFHSTNLCEQFLDHINVIDDWLNGL